MQIGPVFADSHRDRFKLSVYQKFQLRCLIGVLEPVDFSRLSSTSEHAVSRLMDHRGAARVSFPFFDIFQPSAPVPLERQRARVG